MTFDNDTASTEHDKRAAEFEALLRTGMEDLTSKSRAHQDAWGLGREEQWFLDQGGGELVLTFPELVISAPAQVIGTWDQETGIWTWAWEDPSIPQHLQTDACRVREYGIEHGFQHLVNGSWEAEESHCWYMTALAAWLLDANGAYRGTTGSVCTFMMFGDITSNTPPPHAPSELTVQDFMAVAAEEFKACSEDPEAQRMACCRYLRRGALIGIDQSELIHLLGLAIPSVLDLAGYSPESTQSVLDRLKTISDEEIESCDEVVQH